MQPVPDPHLGPDPGDRSANGVDRIFRELAPAVIAWARLRLPPAVQGRVAPEDLAQEVWLRAVRIHARSFDPATMTPRKWLFAVAKFVLLEVQRSAQRLAVERSVDGDTTAFRRLAEAPAEITSLTRRTARDESLQRFLLRVEALPEADRRLIVHRGFEAMPLAQVAKLLRIDVEAATKRWQRLRAQMRRWPATGDLVAD